jgi:DNA-directed RNA polymerase subunit M/transcription elongation factor TFIIS
LTEAINPTSSAPKTNSTLAPSQTYEVNTVKSSTLKNPKKFGGKKKNNNKKKKKNAFEQIGHKTQDPNVGRKIKRKVKYPCMVCKEDHFTK